MCHVRDRRSDWQPSGRELGLSAAPRCGAIWPGNPHRWPPVSGQITRFSRGRWLPGLRATSRAVAPGVRRSLAAPSPLGCPGVCHDPDAASRRVGEGGSGCGGQEAASRRLSPLRPVAAPAPCPSAPARRAPRRKPNLRVFVTGSGRDWKWTSVFQAASSSSVCGVVNH